MCIVQLLFTGSFFLFVQQFELFISSIYRYLNLFVIFGLLMVCLDSSFVGAVEKDSAVLQAEHKSLFETANATELAKKVHIESTA